MGRKARRVLGATGPFVKVMPLPIKGLRDPATTDTDYEVGQLWCNSTTSILYTHLGSGTWEQGGNADATTTVPGIFLINTDGTLAGADNTTVPTALATKTYADAIAVAGAPDASTTVKGIVEIATDAEAVAGTGTGGTGAVLSVSPSNLSGVFAAAPAIGGTTPAAGSFTTLAASGLSSLSGSATILTAGTALNLGSDNDAGAVNLGVGTTARAIGIGSSAAAHVVTVGSVTGASQVILNSGTAGIQLASTGAGDITINSDDTLLLDADGVLELNSSAGVIGIGNDADANAINIGTGAAARTITVSNNTGASSFVVTAGTGAVNLGVNAIAHTTSIGNKTGASALVLDTGTGNFALNGVGATTYTIGAATTSGTIDIGGTAATGTMTLGDSSGTNIVQIGSGEGATTVAIAGGATAAKAVDIGIGAVANVIRIGSVSGAASLALKVGTGNYDLDGAATSTYTVGAATTSGTIDIGGTAQTGTMTLGDSSGTNIVQVGSGEGATTVAIAGGATNPKAVDIAIGAVANVVRIGSVSGAASIALKVGTGNYDLDGAATSTYTVGAATTSGTIDIGGTAQTGTMTLGDSSGTNIVQIGSGEGATTVNVAGGATAGKFVNIATGAVANAVVIGSVSGASSLSLLSGTGRTTMTGTVKDIRAEHVFSSGTDLTVTQSPICQSALTTAVAPTGVAGDINLMYMQDGTLMEYRVQGTQTILAPRMSSTGLAIELDNVSADGVEYGFGPRSNAKHAYTIGTSAAFFFSATLKVVDLSGCAPLMIGFRKVAAYNSVLADYSDYFCAGINQATSGTEVVLLDELNGGGQTITNSTTVWTGGDTGTCTIKVLVSAAGVCTYTIDAGAPAVTNAVTFDSGDVVMPFLFFINGADVAGEVALTALSCGFQA